MRLWEVDSGCGLRVLEGHSDSVWSVAWSADGRYVGSYDKTVRLWEVDSGRCLRVLEGHSDIVRSVAWNTDGRRALSGSADNTVRLWNVENGRCLRVLEGHYDSVLGVVWSTDGRQALSVSDDKTVRLWDVDNGALFCAYSKDTPLASMAWPGERMAARCFPSPMTTRCGCGIWTTGLPARA